jgi:hypothetical protein
MRRLKHCLSFVEIVELDSTYLRGNEIKFRQKNNALEKRKLGKYRMANYQRDMISRIWNYNLEWNEDEFR